MISRSQLIQYGFLALPIAFAGFPLYILAPDFYATHYGVSLSLLGFILLGLRAFDAIQDPFIGIMSDRFSAKILPLMSASALLLVASIYALFNPLATYPVIWFTASMLIAVIAYSILSINLNTLGALWTRDKNEQTRISSVREAFGLLGLIIAVTLPNILGNYLPANQVFTCFSAILLAVMLIALINFTKWYRANPSGKNQPDIHPKNLWANLRVLPTATRNLFLVYGVSVLASSIPALLVIFFIRDRLNSEDYTGLFLLLYFLAGACSMPLWKKLSVKYGKYRAWLSATLLAVTSFIGAFFLGTGDAWQYGIICIASGMALGADLILPPSILADHIHEYESGYFAATQFSILTLLTKAGLAIGSAIALPLLDMAGFVPAAINSDAALTTLSIAYALIPCLLKLVAAYLLYHLFIAHKKELHYETSLETSIRGSSNHA